MGLADTLWHENAFLAQETLQHPFVRGLRDGSLPRSNFQAYVAQDAYFLDTYVRSYALALAHCKDQMGMREFLTLLTGAVEELRLHASYALEWEIDLDVVRPVPATLAYTDFLLATAALKGVGETCAAMAPCMRLYAFLGQSLHKDNAMLPHAYSDWITTYASADFALLAERLDYLLDRYAADDEEIHNAYRRAMELELAFFQAQSYGLR